MTRQDEANERVVTANMDFVLNADAAVVFATGLVVYGLAAGIAWTWKLTSFHSPMFGWPQLMCLQFWLIGASYGLVSGGCWTMTIISSPQWRCLARVAMATAVAGVMTETGFESFYRYLLGTAGFSMFQLVLISIARLPNWKRPCRESGADNPHLKQRQFTIGDIAASTAVAAGCFALLFWSNAPIDMPQYWMILFALWILLPLAATCAFATLARRNTVLLAVSAALTAALVIALLSDGYYRLEWVEAKAFSGEALLFGIPMFSRIVGGFMLAICVFVLAGSVSSRRLHDV